jgi:hypothetical protein
VFDDIETLQGGIFSLQFVDAHVENAPAKYSPGGHDLRIAHPTGLAERGDRASYLLGVPEPRSSILTEVGWLAYFAVVFVVAVYALVGLLVPHHFNDKIAIALAALFAGLAMIGTRAWLTNRQRPR